MEKKKSKATKPGLKGISGPAKKRRGGARPGAGRPGKGYEAQQMHIDAPISLLKKMDAAGIENRTVYVIGLIEKDLANR